MGASVGPSRLTLCAILRPACTACPHSCEDHITQGWHLRGLGLHGAEVNPVEIWTLRALGAGLQTAWMCVRPFLPGLAALAIYMVVSCCQVAHPSIQACQACVQHAGALRATTPAELPHGLGTAYQSPTNSLSPINAYQPMSIKPLKVPGLAPGGSCGCWERWESSSCTLGAMA